MFKLRFEKRYLRKYGKLVKNNKHLKTEISRVLKLLSEDPFSPALKTRV